MTPKQFDALKTAAAAQHLQVSSTDRARSKFRVSRANGPSTLYFRLDGMGKFTRAGGCDQQAFELDLLLAAVLNQAGSESK